MPHLSETIEATDLNQTVTNHNSEAHRRAVCDRLVAKPGENGRVISSLVVDAANVVGSRPDGWWRDRPGAARRLHASLGRAATGYDQVILVLEGQARAGVEAGQVGAVRTVHAERDGDAAIVDLCRASVAAGPTAVVTADRALSDSVRDLGAQVRRPGWLLELLD